mmetsp:Transcript_21514/g.26393  ORF Transcript_21514/g.26393 Transcript_21514/m.26393 type:complete len:319 (+) Transcript_21514:103-1059(+)
MGDFVYEGIVAVTIDVVDSPTDANPNRVTFSADASGRRDDSTATFIYRIKDVKDKNNGLLEATKLTVKEVQSIVNAKSENAAERSTDEKDEDTNRKILFSVHGYNGNPRGYLLQVKYYEQRFKKFQIVPVIWPSAGFALGYFSDKALSRAAGKAFQSLIPISESFSKSILCHSMGNRVLKYFAKGPLACSFDNIFMVAPDLNNDLFNKNNVERGNNYALLIKDLLTKEKGGKIHVLYNKNDSDLLLSTVVNFGCRLGRQGVPLDDDDGCNLFRKKDSVHPAVKDFVVNVDWTNNTPSHPHNYQFDWSVVHYYESQYLQ